MSTWQHNEPSKGAVPPPPGSGGGVVFGLPVADPGVTMAQPVQGKPLYPSSSEPALAQRFSIQGYQDVWAAALFVLTMVATVIIGSYNYSDNLGYVDAALKNNTSSSSSSQTATGSSSDPTQQPAVAVASLVAVGLLGTVIAFLAAGASLLCLAKWPRQMIVGANVAVAVLYVVAAIPLFAQKAIWGGVILLLVAGLQLLWLYLVRDRIPFAALLLHLSSRLIAKYKATIATSFIGVVTFYVFSLFWLSMVFPTAVRVTEQRATDFDGMNLIIFLFISFWAAQVVTNVVHVTTSGLVATWYFVGDLHMPPSPTLASLTRAMTTSFGSICFGSMIVAIIKTLRAVANANRRNNNGLVACVMVCLLQCLERMLRYFNTYAFVHVAIYGCGYVEAAKRTWDLVTNAGNGFRALFNDCLIGPTIGLTALGMSIFVGVMSALIFNAGIGIILFVLTFAVHLIVLRGIESAVPTIFVCFAEAPDALLVSSAELYNKLQGADNGTHQV